MIADSIVSAIRNLSTPGRFLKKDSKTRRWQSVDDSLAREKTLQALREKSKHYRAQLDSQASQESKSEPGGYQDASSTDGSASRDQLRPHPNQLQQAPLYYPPPTYPGYMYPAYYHGSYPTHPHPHPSGAQHLPHAPYLHQPPSYHASTMPLPAAVAAANNAPEDMDSSATSQSTRSNPPPPAQQVPPVVQREQGLPVFGMPLLAPPPLQYQPGLQQQFEPRQDEAGNAPPETMPYPAAASVPTRQVHQDQGEAESPDTEMAITAATTHRAAFPEDDPATPRGPATPSKAAFLESPSSLGSFYRSTPPDARTSFSFGHYYNSLSPAHSIPLQLQTRLSPPAVSQPQVMQQLHAQWYHNPASSRTSPPHAPPPRPPSMGPSDYASVVQQPPQFAFPRPQMQQAAAGEKNSQHGHQRHDFREVLAYSPLRRREDAERREPPFSSMSHPPHYSHLAGSPGQQNLDSYVASPGLLHLFAAGHAAAGISPTATPRPIPLPGATLSPRNQRARGNALRSDGEERCPDSTTQQSGEDNPFQRYG